MRKIIIIFVFFLSACSIKTEAVPVVEPTGTALPFATATMVPTFTPRPSPTLIPPTIGPTLAPIMAQLINQVNVRISPDIKSESLGLLNYGTDVQVLGKNQSEKWIQIIYPINSASSGWVSADYLTLKAEDIKNVPVVLAETINEQSQPAQLNGTQESPVMTFTPTPIIHQAKVTRQIFVRKGPGQTFDSMGTVEQGSSVILTGRNQNNVWAQIRFDAGAVGTGWVATAYLEGADYTGLPYFDNQGIKISEGSQVQNPILGSATSTSYPSARMDGDSKDNPIARIVFTPDGTGSFTFSGEVSSPEGDNVDWIAFTPYSPDEQSTTLIFKLECSGNGGMSTVISLQGQTSPEWKPLACGNYDVGMKFIGGKEYFLKLNADGSYGPIRYVSYKITISSIR